jgi:hypothetical protein
MLMKCDKERTVFLEQLSSESVLFVRDELSSRCVGCHGDCEMNILIECRMLDTSRGHLPPLCCCQVTCHTARWSEPPEFDDAVAVSPQSPDTH